jgi:hypothetical protein
MQKYILSLMVALALILFMAAPVRAEEALFFEALYDVPVMPGLHELKDQAIIFDKPDGKIASASAAANHLAPKEIEVFYTQTLMELGWRKTDKNQYVRKDEKLTLSFSGKAPETIVQFTLRPLPQE